MALPLLQKLTKHDSSGTPVPDDEPTISLHGFFAAIRLFKSGKATAGQAKNVIQNSDGSGLTTAEKDLVQDYLDILVGWEDTFAVLSLAELGWIDNATVKTHLGLGAAH